MKPAKEWKPAHIPDNLTAFAKPCPHCLRQRQALLDFLATMNSTTHTLFVMNGDQAVGKGALGIRCMGCCDTGWEFDPKALDLLQQFQELRDDIRSAHRVAGDALVEVTPDDDDVVVVRKRCK